MSNNKFICIGENMEYRNKNNGKIVKIIREEESIIWFKIDGLEVPLAKTRFNKVYEKVDDKSE